MWITWCFTRFAACEKHLLQILQACGFSPEWTNMCWKSKHTNIYKKAKSQKITCLIYPMQIGLLCKRFLTNVAFVGAFAGVAFFMFPPATVFAKCFHAYATFVYFFRAWGRCNGSCIICLCMVYHSMGGQLLFIIEILN